ncbi:MAG TPA: HAD-IA family hydrolase, partial [Thermoanaerobaculia bacterium]|nr:HAD-IA family hydrolase [Thermoanaerobaculia bacterium]
GRRIVDDIREMRAFFGWKRPEQELFDERQRYFDEEIARSDLQLMRGAERTVRALHERGFVLAVTSSAVRAAIETILRRAGLLAMFAAIVDGSEVTSGKPDPGAYLVTARRLGVDPAHCVVFEDSNVGVRAAKAAGMFCIAVRNPNAFYRQDLDAADIVMSSFDEVDIAWFYPSARTTSRRS